MATSKRPQRAASKHAEAKSTPVPGLRCTDTEGVYLNAFNVPCDADGLALGFATLKALDRAKLAEVIDESADTPAKFLKALALDPRQPMAVRFEAAKAAAPYFDRKAPVAIDGGLDDAGKAQPLNFAVLDELPKAKLLEMLDLLGKMGFKL